MPSRPDFRALAFITDAPLRPSLLTCEDVGELEDALMQPCPADCEGNRPCSTCHSWGYVPAADFDAIEVRMADLEARELAEASKREAA